MTASIFETTQQTSCPARSARSTARRIPITTTVSGTTVYALERVPLPAIRPLAPTSRTPLYPFRSMKVGQSFLIPAQGRARGAASRRVINNAQAYQRATGAKFMVRSVEDGVRCWRIA